MHRELRNQVPARDDSQRRGLAVGVILGNLAMLVLACLVGLCVAGLGLFPVDADTQPLAAEKAIAQWALHRAVSRHAAQESVPPTDLMDGLHVYYNQCIACHGGPQPERDGHERVFYPPPPHFSAVGSALSEPQVGWVVRHGIRLTGMPSFRASLSDQQIADVSAFVTHLQALPADVARTWNR